MKSASAYDLNLDLIDFPKIGNYLHDHLAGPTNRCSSKDRLLEILTKVPKQRDLRDMYCLHPKKTQTINAPIKINKKLSDLKQKFILFLEKQNLEHKIKEQLKKKIRKITSSARYCDGEGIQYHTLNNHISGCMDEKEDPLLVEFILSHELAHSLDPCSYHFGPSDFSYNPLNWGPVLKFSDPMNWNQSLDEFPFKKYMMKQHSEILSAKVNFAQGQNPEVCTHIKSNEFFADTIAAEVLNLSQIDQEDKIKIIKGFCPTKIDKVTYILDQSQTEEASVKTEKVWSDEDNAIHLSFNIRARQILNYK